MKAKSVLLLVPVLIILLLILQMDLKFLTVTGTSMNPEITEKDVIIIAPADSKSLKVGDIISYNIELDGKPYIFTHRITAIGNGTIKTKGDFMPKEDSYNVSFQDVRGVVIGKIPYLGLVIRFASTTTGYILLILIPAILLIAKEIKKVRGANI